MFAAVTLIAVAILFLTFLHFAAAGARPWYFLPPMALAAACFDFGIPLVCLPRLLRATVLGLLMGTALAGVLFASTDLRGHFTDVDKLAKQIEKTSSPGDFVIVTPWFCGLTFDRYFHGTAQWQTLPPLADHTTHRYDLVLQQMQDTNSLALILEKISTTLRAGHRVWIVGLADFSRIEKAEPTILPPPPLKGHGWSDTPYTESWSARTAYFISQHSEHFETSSTSGNQPNFQENLRLFVASGWRD